MPANWKGNVGRALWQVNGDAGELCGVGRKTLQTELAYQEAWLLLMLKPDSELHHTNYHYYLNLEFLE